MLCGILGNEWDLGVGTSLGYMAQPMDILSQARETVVVPSPAPLPTMQKRLEAMTGIL